MPVPPGNSYLNTELSTNGAQNVDSIDVQRDSIGYPKCADFSSPIARRGLRRFRKVFPTTPEPRECRRLPHRTTHPIPGMRSGHRTALPLPEHRSVRCLTEPENYCTPKN